MRQPLATITSTAMALSQWVMRIHTGWMGTLSAALILGFMAWIIRFVTWQIYHQMFN